MVFAQNYMNASNNGMDPQLQAGAPTVGNIVNGYFERPMYKIKGVFPDFNENRSMPLRLFEIVEINWRDFAQYVGKLQGFGWEFIPELHDAFNTDKTNLEKLKEELEELNKQKITETKNNAQLLARLESSKAILERIKQVGDVKLGMQDVGEDTLKEAEQLTKFTDDSGYPLTIAAMEGSISSSQKIYDAATAYLNSILEEIGMTEKEIQDLQDKIDTEYKDLNPDELGLTDAFMHAVYTEFLKRFWAYNIGVLNPELWFLQVNAFFGNELPMLYKGARMMAESKDFSQTQWQAGGGSVVGSTTGNERASNEQFGDSSNKGHNQGVGATANTPQSRLNLNARNMDFGNQVNNTEGSQQGVNSQAGVSSRNQESSTTTTNTSNNKSQQWQLSPLATWNRVLATNGYFGELWNKAWQYGLFDACN